jgi:hypothetical protein
MATERPADFIASDGQTNVTQRVRAAFWDEGIPVVVAGPAGLAPGPPPPQPPLPADKVNEMLETKAD